MYLREFHYGPRESGMMDSLRARLMDYLTPLVVRKVAYVTVTDIAETLREYRTGFTIDRSFIMELINPDEMKIVKKIEGDKVYLDFVEAANSEISAEEKQREEDKIKNTAAKQAKKELDK